MRSQQLDSSFVGFLNEDLIQRKLTLVKQLKDFAGEAIQREQTKFVVIGNTSSGKTSLLDLLLQQQISLQGPELCTTVPIEYNVTEGPFKLRISFPKLSQQAREYLSD